MHDDDVGVSRLGADTLDMLDLDLDVGRATSVVLTILDMLDDILDASPPA